MSVLIIGIGNTLRGDDGAGIVAAQRLSACWRAQAFPHVLIMCHQLTPELAEDLAAPNIRAVLFVDAAVAIGEPIQPDMVVELAPGCTLRPLGRAGNDGSGGGARLAHHVGPAEVLGYVEGLYGRRVPAWLLCLPCVETPFGEDLSAPVYAALRAIEDGAESIWQRVMGRGTV